MSGILKVLAALLVAAFITFLLFFSEKGEHAEPVVIPESLTELPSPVTGKPFVSEALAESIVARPVLRWWHGKAVINRCHGVVGTAVERIM